MKVVVVVEDDEDMCILVKLILAEDPAVEVVGEAASAMDAVALARQHQPDLVILDHFIEGDIMGLQAAPMLKTAAPKTRILLFTSHDLGAEVSRQPAVDAYLRKDNLDQLLPVVRSLMAV